MSRKEVKINTKRDSTMFTLQDLATLVALMKQYRNELVVDANYKYDNNIDQDYKETSDAIEIIEKALEVAMDDFEYRIKNY